MNEFNHYALIKRYSQAVKQESREAALVTAALLCLQGKLDCRLHRSLIFTSSVNPLHHSRSLLLREGVYVQGGGFTSASPQTPFIQDSYKEPPYPAKTNSIEEVETNAFVFELYLVTARLHPNVMFHETRWSLL